MELHIIKQRIYTIRGQKVMLDFDLAELYDVETKVFKQGVAMLSSILNSDKAIEMNIAIISAFIALRQAAITHSDIISHLIELRDRLGEHDVQLTAIYETIENLLDKKVEEETWDNRAERRLRTRRSVAKQLRRSSATGSGLRNSYPSQ